MTGAVPLRDDFVAADLRRLAKSCKDPRQIRRLLALAGVYDGMSRADAARIGAMDRQTLRDWVHRFNEAGPQGVINPTGPRRRRNSCWTHLWSTKIVKSTSFTPRGSQSAKLSHPLRNCEFGYTR